MQPAMDDVSELLKDFDGFLDGLLQGNKELQIGVKSVSTINKVDRILGSQCYISPHTEMNRNLFVVDAMGKPKISFHGPPAEPAMTQQPITHDSLLEIFKKVFDDLTVYFELPRRLCLRRTKFSRCSTT